MPQTIQATTEEKALLVKGQDYVVNLVNPKLKAFTRTFWLALVIGILSFVVFLIILFYLLLQCSSSSAVVPRSDLKTVTKFPGYKCVAVTQVLNIFPGPPMRAEYKNCMFDTENAGFEYCDGLLETYIEGGVVCQIPQGRDSCTDSEGNWLVIKSLGEIDKCEDLGAANTPTMIYYDVCPIASVTVGVALGYMGLAESLVTLLILAICIPTGIVTVRSGSLTSALSNAVVTPELKGQIKGEVKAAGMNQLDAL